MALRPAAITAGTYRFKKEAKLKKTLLRLQLRPLHLHSHLWQAPLNNPPPGAKLQRQRRLHGEHIPTNRPLLHGEPSLKALRLQLLRPHQQQSEDGETQRRRKRLHQFLVGAISPLNQQKLLKQAAGVTLRRPLRHQVRYQVLILHQHGATLRQHRRRKLQLGATQQQHLHHRLRLGAMLRQLRQLLPHSRHGAMQQLHQLRHQSQDGATPQLRPLPLLAAISGQRHRHGARRLHQPHSLLQHHKLPLQK